MVGLNWKITLFGCFCIAGFKGHTQQISNFFSDTIPTLNSSTSGSFDYGSNISNNQFINKFIFGGTISSDDKDNLYTNLHDRNVVGGDFNLNLQVEIPVDSFLHRKNFSWIVGIEHTEHFDAKISSDLVKIIFDGNKQFAGKNAQIGSTNFNYLNYQQLNIGFINYKESNGKSAKEGAVFSIIKGQEHQAITIPRGSLFTENLGNELLLDLNYIYNSSDSTNKGLKAFNGIGISTNFFTEFNLNHQNKVSIDIDDLGFIQWSDNSIQIEADTVFKFKGVQIDNIFDINDSVISSLSKDSILEYVSTKKDLGGYSVVLPTSLNINFQHSFNTKFKAVIGLQYRVLANYFPLFYTNIQYNLTPKFIVQGNLIYGGYGKFNGGFTFAKQIKNRFQIIAGTNNMGSYLLPSSTYSNNGFLGLKAYF